MQQMRRRSWITSYTACAVVLLLSFLLGTALSIWFAQWSAHANSISFGMTGTLSASTAPDGIARTYQLTKDHWHETLMDVVSVDTQVAAVTSTQIALSGHQDQILPRLFDCPVPTESLSGPRTGWFEETHQIRLVGWPARSFWSKRIYVHHGMSNFQTVNLVSTDNSRAYRWVGLADGELAIGPIWGGLIINALAFSAVVMLPLVVLFRAWRPIIRGLRIRRGHCPHCAYDLSGTAAGMPCPECGEVAEPRRPKGPESQEPITHN